MNSKKRIINGIEVPEGIILLDKVDEQKFYPDSEDIALIHHGNKKHYCLAIIDMGASGVPYIDLQEAFSLNYPLKCKSTENIFIAGCSFTGYPTHATINFRGILMETECLALYGLKDLIHATVLISKPFLVEYSHNVGLNGKITLNFTDDKISYPKPLVLLTQKQKKYFGCVYKIVNKINGKVYIGITIQKLKRRLSQHFSVAKRGKKTIFCEAIRKYGNHNFSIQILEKCNNKKELLEREKEYIKKYKSNVFRYGNPSLGYNMTDGGESYIILLGEEHPQYVEIDLSDLQDLIKEGYTVQEIASEFNVGCTVIYNRINELGYANIHEARNEIGGKKTYEQKRHERMSQSAKERGISEETKKLWSENRKGKGNSRYVKIERNDLISIISKRRKITLEDIGAKLGICKNTIMKKIRELFDMTFPDFKDEYYFKPLLKRLLSMGASVDKIQKDLEYKSKGNVHDKIMKIFETSYGQAINIFWIYPQIDADLVQSMIEENASIEDIDKAIYIELIMSQTIREMALKLHINKDTVIKRIRTILNFNSIIEAREAFGGPEVAEFFEARRRERISLSKMKI